LTSSKVFSLIIYKIRGAKYKEQDVRCKQRTIVNKYRQPAINNNWYRRLDRPKIFVSFGNEYKRKIWDSSKTLCLGENHSKSEEEKFSINHTFKRSPERFNLCIDYGIW
jgi:hypothetical protein